MYNMNVGERIRSKRLEKGMTLLEVANLLGVKEATVQRYESGEIKNLKQKTIAHLAEIFDTSPAFLMGWEKNLETDTDFIAEMMMDSSLIEHVKMLLSLDEENKKTVLQIVAAWKKIYKNNGVELMVIPSGQQASEEKVQEIQNEITTGEGPDVFLAEGPNPTWSEQRAVVFEDPKKEMYQGTFLSLKPYMKYFDIDILEEKILSAGMANEEQILIPMTYDYFLYAFTTQDLPENTEISRNWLELARQKEKAIQQIVGQRSGVQFFDTFSEVVDYKKKTLLYSEEQIKKVLDETVALKTRSLALNWKIKDTGVVSLNDLEELGGEKTVHTVFAMPNQEGGFTANVTLYAGINKNTKQPLKAVSFLQMLYSEEVLSGKGIELEDRREASNIRFPQGVSIYKKELEKRMRSLSRQDQKQIKTIQEEVNTVRFYSVWDRELNSLLSKYEAQEDEKQKEHVFIKTIQKWKGKIQK